MTTLPRATLCVGTPPIKCQGIKTKLVPFIFNSVQWDMGRDGRWIEPFFGSGVVGLNLRPDHAVFTDTNRHIIDLYRSIQCGEITGSLVREFIEEAGNRLRAGGADYYYEVRARFNDQPNSLDFLFLNRSCFNGVMRFNSKGRFNVPFGHKPERFAKAYVTKIVNQVNWVARQMRDRDWTFRVSCWSETLDGAVEGDFVYIDPPYIGRHTDYYNRWDETEAANLAVRTRALPCGFALSMWYENRYRKNGHIADHWDGLELRLCRHFYHVGSTENLRNEMNEALVIARGYATPDQGIQGARVERGNVPVQHALIMA